MIHKQYHAAVEHDTWLILWLSQIHIFIWLLKNLYNTIRAQRKILRYQTIKYSLRKLNEIPFTILSQKGHLEKLKYEFGWEVCISEMYVKQKSLW